MPTVFTPQRSVYAHEVDQQYSVAYTQPLPTDVVEANDFTLPPTHIRIAILEARNLRNMDGTSATDKYSDPFAMMTFADQRGQPYWNVVFRTRTIEECLDPQWNEEFVLELKHGDVACSGAIEVWDADENNSRDFLGAARVEFDVNGRTHSLELGPRLEPNPTLVKAKNWVNASMGYGTIHVKWKYERHSTPRMDAELFVERGNNALRNRKYDHALQLYTHAKQCNPLDYAIDELITNVLRLKNVEQKCVKEDVTDTALSENALRAQFNSFDRNGNGFLDKQEFADMYSDRSFGLVQRDTIMKIVSDYNMLGDDKISFDEFAIIMLKLAASS